ncbi:MAG: adenylate/guanylate cyclase domain-containing protein [Proteobacteria bacterium]|nr:adenylate/guanylate cyclase domain-containing protein [Pseudomonadota bacterium]
MNLRLKSNKQIKLIAGLSAALLLIVLLAWTLVFKDWTRWDYQSLDIFYRQAVEKGLGPELSPRIVYLTISDNTYKSFGKNILDRYDLARVSYTLAEIGAGAVVYDIIFARPTNPESDAAFASSLKKYGAAYLPVGVAFADNPQKFRWEEGEAFKLFKERYLQKPNEKGSARPFYATRALMQEDSLAASACNSGHISAYSDPDGVFRHVLMLIKVDDEFFPALSLAVFLDYVRVPFASIIVKWGDHIIIPPVSGSLLEKEVRIPIDERGRAFIPFAQVWEKGFSRMEAHKLLELYGDKNLRGNLTDFFEGNFVLITDIAVGASDLGQTPLESDVPLAGIHASLLNGMLTDTFYSKWTIRQITFLVCFAGFLLFLAALPRSTWPLYFTGAAALAGLPALTWIEMTRFILFPVITVMFSVFFIFFGLIIVLKTVAVRERAFIKGAFAKYLPAEVVDRLLEEPERLKLGGEEQTLTILFSDIVNFTAITEKSAPQSLVRLLNEYMTEMTSIILDCGGIIDKYQGDAIMAEFGAPLPMSDHADKAVTAGLRMQRRLCELQQVWRMRGLPELSCRVGINTGSVIIGNMGSQQVFDYTVIGDAVNLASRLEGANRDYGTFLMISEFTFACLTPGRFKTRFIDNIEVKGRSQHVKVFEVSGLQDETAPLY